MNDGNLTRAGNIAAIERATGISWAEWLAVFETTGASKLPHSDIARIALETMPASLSNPEWWAQGAAIAFEQHAGLRVPGQSSSGEYRVGASRTIPRNRDEAIERWAALVTEQPDQLGREFTNVRRSRTEKRTFWRAALADTGKFEIAAEAKGEDRALVAIQHTGLADAAQIEAWRAHWKARLAEL